MTDSQVISEVTGFPVKPMPGPTRWLQRRFWPWILLPGFLITGFTGSFIPFTIAIGVALVVTSSIVCHVRCPKCKCRLSPREFAETKYRRRLYYDCSTCHITWESELVNEDD